MTDTEKIVNTIINFKVYETYGFDGIYYECPFCNRRTPVEHNGKSNVTKMLHVEDCVVNLALKMNGSKDETEISKTEGNVVSEGSSTGDTEQVHWPI